MKHLAVVMLVALFVTTTEARTLNSKSKTISTQKSKFDVRIPVKNWIKKFNDGFRVGIAQGSLATNLRARTNGVDESINKTNSSKIQLQAGYEKIMTKKIGYSAFFTYQDIGNGLTDFEGNKEDIRSMRFSANATYGLTDQAYTYGGLNLNKYYGSEEIEANVERGIGYQAGVGFKFHKRANLEIEYLSLMNEGRISNTNLDIETKGIMLKLNTPISFNL